MGGSNDWMGTVLAVMVRERGSRWLAVYYFQPTESSRPIEGNKIILYRANTQEAYIKGGPDRLASVKRRLVEEYHV